MTLFVDIARAVLGCLLIVAAWLCERRRGCYRADERRLWDHERAQALTCRVGGDVVLIGTLVFNAIAVIMFIGLLHD